VDKCECKFLGDQADVEVIHSGFLPRPTQVRTTLVLVRGDDLVDQRSAHDRSDRPPRRGARCGWILANTETIAAVCGLSSDIGGHL
jgi:hypothetical protein